MTVTAHPFGDRRELLQVELHDGVSEETRVLLGVPLGHIHYVRFQNNGPDLAIALEAVHGGHGVVVPEAVLAANDGETDDVAFVVEEVEALGAGGCRQPGDDVDVASGADDELEILLDMAALDEVLVGLGVVEAADDGPDSLRRRVDSLGEEGGALARGHGVGVVLQDRGYEVCELLRSQPGWGLQVVVGRVRLSRILLCAGGVGSVHSERREGERVAK